MRIKTAVAHKESFELSRPYTIAFRAVTAVDNVVIRIETDQGISGWGAGSPEPFVTGETIEKCEEELGAIAEWLTGREISFPETLDALSTRAPGAPAARAAADIALHDVIAKAAGKPLADFLGRRYDVFPTSITIGIKDVRATLDEADEYLGRGFRVIKLKLGKNFDEDVARVRALFERVGNKALIRLDMNQGYAADEVIRFFEQTRGLPFEFAEQPLPKTDFAGLRALPSNIRARIAADEMLQTVEDAHRLVEGGPACGVFNIKLMKCGGVTTGRRIAEVAAGHGIDLMWGCMDESRISIAAALHAALACSATKYLDLDGSLDLGRDIVRGGFELRDGRMRVTGKPGLGVEPM